MANLLPQEEQKKIAKEYHVRLATVSVFVCAVLVVVNLVFLAPAYLEAYYKERDAVSRIERFSNSSTGEVGPSDEELNKRVLALNKKILSFIPKGDEGLSRSVPTTVLAKIIDAKTSGVRITGFTYNFEQGRERFVVSGIARDRASLAAYVDTLKKDTYFTTTELPIQSYVKSVDIDFTLTLVRVVKAPPVKK